MTLQSSALIQNKMAEETESTSADRELKDEDHLDLLKRQHFLNPDSDQINLNLLLEAVLDISKKLDRNKELGEEDLPQTSTSTEHDTSRSSEKTVEFEERSSVSSASSRPRSNYRYSGSKKPGAIERKNLSFSNSSVIDIDRENQRLLRKITTTRSVRPKSATVTRRSFMEPMRVQTHAEVNRSNFQKRVDEENQKMLQRLQSVRPTKSLSKAYLSKEADTKKHFICANAPKCRPSSARSTVSSRSKMSRSARKSSLTTSDSSSVASSRPSTASSSRRSRQRREFPKPAWEPGW